MIDPRLHGTLTVIARTGYETADPRLDAEAVARGYAYRYRGSGAPDAGMRMALTALGRRALNDAGEKA